MPTHFRIVHIIYSGLGGHGSVFFSLTDSNKDPYIRHIPLFFGVEDVLDEYQEKCKKRQLPIAYVSKKQGFDRASWRELRLKLQEINPDYIVLHSVYAILPVWQYARQANCKFCVVEHTPIAQKGKISWLWTSLAFILAQKVVVLSPVFQKGLKQKLPFLYQEKKVVLIPNGIDVEVFRPVTKSEPSDDLIISMHSRLTPQKDHKSLLYAIARLKGSGIYDRIMLKIAGDGACKSELLALSRELAIEDKVAWLGMLKEEAIVNLLQETDIYVHPTFSETMSTSLMQAMAVGLPIITTDIPGVTHMVVHGETGICTAKGEIEPLADAITQLATDVSLREKLGQASHEYALMNFSNVYMARKYATLIPGHITLE